MDRTIMESLQQWKLLAREGDSEARNHLRAVLHYAMELSRKADYSTLEEVRYQLEHAIAKEEPADMASYCMGMARGMADWMSASAHAAKSEEMKAALPELESQLLRCIADNPRITPSQIMERTSIGNKQHVSNLLSKLRAKELVNYWQAGKNRWYSITELGQRILAELRTDEEQASAAPATIRYVLKLSYAKVADNALKAGYPIMRMVSEPMCRYPQFQYDTDIFANGNGMAGNIIVDKPAQLPEAVVISEFDEEDNRKVLA